uniref:EGF-like domain-containing protein n=1 Tax=Romanomermis culicivorax TaxID=13658 RepID=A0A915KPQ4_ROMCU
MSKKLFNVASSVFYAHLGGQKEALHCNLAFYYFAIFCSTLTETCRRDGCSDRNAFCDSDSNQCKCKGGFHNNGRRCESISPKDTFNCKRFSFPCGMYDANFGENEQKICFCLKERR